MPEQLGFALPGISALGRSDFLVAPSNALAVALVEGWQNWTPRKCIISGPEGAGKTHLAHVWAELSGAVILPARDLAKAEIPDLARRCVAVEDVPGIAQDPTSQTALFHLHNLLLAEGNSLLMTGAGAPARWGIDLPDLASRIEGTAAANLDPPDDTLLAAVLAKQFADLQLTPNPNLIPYLLKRIDRSFAAAREIVAQLDAASLAQKRPLTRALAAEVLDKQLRDAR